MLPALMANTRIIPTTNSPTISAAAAAYAGLFHSTFANPQKPLSPMAIAKQVQCRLPFLLLFVTLQLPLLSLDAAQPTEHAGDRAALLNLRSHLTDPRGALASWSWNSSCCSSWVGLSCDNATGRVIALDLAGLGLTGPIPSCLSDLRELRTLDMSRNALLGPIPPELARLQQLEALVLAENPGLGDGPIPAWIGNFSFELQKLDLRSGSFTGEIPESLFHLGSLRYLDLSGNLLTGILGDFDAPLVSLNLAGNRLSGTLFCFSNSARTLTVLNLSNNSIVGGIPTCISSLRALTELNLSSNSLSFKLSPRLIFSEKLVVLDLSSNALSGPIPSRIVEDPERSGLLLLDFSGNQFSGEIPPEITEMRSLQALFLARNYLSGEIPAAIGNLTYLQALDLSNNALSGAIPASLAGCFQLWQLSLAHNNLSGALRPELDALDGLRILDLAGNHLSGEIPLPLAGCKSLEVVDLTDNDLAGELSGAVLKWQGLRLLSLARNRFSGNLPDWIFSFPSLRFLDLSGNRFSGFIPGGGFNLSSEFTTGGEPSQNTAHSGEVSISVSVDLGGSSRQLELSYELQVLAGIDLSNNALRGEIPGGLISLRGLEYLNLSYNYFAGEIPAGVKGMGRLRSLDLSHNALSGEVPSGIPGLGELEELNLSYNCLSGSVPEKEKLRRFPGAFAGNPGLCVAYEGKEGCGAEAGMPAAEGDDGGGEGEEGLISVGAFWISAVVSFYVTVVGLLCSGKARDYVFRALKPEL